MLRLASRSCAELLFSSPQFCILNHHSALVHIALDDSTDGVRADIGTDIGKNTLHFGIVTPVERYILCSKRKSSEFANGIAGGLCNLILTDCQGLSLGAL